MPMLKMMCTLVLAAAFLSPGQSVDVSASKNRPVSKVITILKDMMKTLEKEGEEDEEIYDKLACWCDTNEKEKTKAIAEAEKTIAHLTSKVEELTANSARLTEEIDNLGVEKKANQEALDKATALRQKDLAEFTQEEKDMVESISALNSAISVLSKHHSSLLQVPRNHILGVVASVQHQIEKHARLLDGVLTPTEKKVVAAFAQAPSYNVRSGQIFGILTTMKETFESNLAASQKEDKSGATTYTELKAAKEAEIKAETDQIDDKTQELAESNSKIAQAKEDIEATKDTLSADEQFLAMLKEKCSVTDAEWEQRQKTRAGEMEAVSKALQILSSSDSHDLFTKTFNAAFVQKHSSMQSAGRLEASKLIALVAKKTRNPHLATLSVAIRLDAFTRVKKAIDDMVAELTKEKTDEISHRDWCISELNTNEAETTSKEREKADLNTKIETLEMEIKSLTADIDALTKEIAEMQLQMKRAGQDREKANNEFQAIVADQRETQQVLSSALKVLKDWYAKEETALLQRQEPAGPPPPPGFSTYKDNEHSGGVIKMLETIISDAKTMEAETIRSEEDEQKAYEDFVKETNQGVELNTAELNNKKADKAKAEAANVQAGKDHDDVTLELEQLANFNGELHTSCDYIMKNFEIRQTARDEEIEALKQAKAILSGAKFIQMLKAE